MSNPCRLKLLQFAFTKLYCHIQKGKEGKSLCGFFNPNISVKDKTCSGTTVPVFVCQLLCHSAPGVKKHTPRRMKGSRKSLLLLKGILFRSEQQRRTHEVKKKRINRRPHAMEANDGGNKRRSHPSSAIRLFGPSSTLLYPYLTSLCGKCTRPIQLNSTLHLATSPAQDVYFDPQTVLPQVSFLPSYPLWPPVMESKQTCFRVLHYKAAPNLNVFILIPLSSLHSKSKAKNPFFPPFFIFFSHSSRCS